MATLGPDTQGFPASVAEVELTRIDFGSLISLIPENIIERYQEDPSSRASVVSILRQARKQVAQTWLNLPESQLKIVYSTDIGNVHQMLLSSGIKDEPLADIEEDFVDELVAQVSKGFDEPKAIHYLLAATLYFNAYQLPLKYDFTAIPDWFLEDYLQFVFYSPEHCQRIGEMRSYYYHIKQLVDYVYTNVFNNQASQFWCNIASFFAQGLNCLLLHFSTENLRDIFTKRAELMEFTLQTSGLEVNHTFSKRSANRKKVLLGVLAYDLRPRSETYSLIPFFEYLDKDKFEIILYVYSITGKPLEKYCCSRADQLIELPKDLHSQVQTIRAKELDILLIGTMVNKFSQDATFLALHRLAPVQATYFVSPATTGMRNIDYYITGTLLEPGHNAQEHYSEQLVTLDGTGFCYNLDGELDAPTIKPNRKNIHVPDTSIVFISGASFHKIIPELQETWAKIIAAVPNSVLVLYPFSPTWSQSYPEQYLHISMSATFAKYGIEKNRLLMLKIKGRSNVKECLKLGNVYLDSYPFSGATSTIEALEVGLPTVTREGHVLRSRTSAALLRELQIPDLIVSNEKDYIKLAIALGTNPKLRKQKSEQIQQKMQGNPKFLDSHAYSTQIGSLFEKLCKKHLIL